MVPKWIRRAALLAGVAAAAAPSVALAPPVAGAPPQRGDTIETLRELARPTPMHRHLERYVGTWESEGRFWLDDGSSGEIVGTIESELIHDGLFVESRVGGQLLGEPYVGRGILGYDAAVGEFVELWLDNLGTGAYRLTGGCEDPACDRRTVATQFIDPVWGSEMKLTVTVTWEDEDTYRHETTLTHADGRSFPQLEFTARRVR